jgi:mono/diheme cytochrome c family protein
MNAAKFIFWSTLLFVTVYVARDYSRNNPASYHRPGRDYIAPDYVIDGDSYLGKEIGQKLFRTNCTACHQLGRELIGPDLRGVRNRWRDITKLYKFVRNGAAMVKKGDPYAMKLFKKYGRIVHPRFNLSNVQIDSILAYVSDESGPVW